MADSVQVVRLQMGREVAHWMLATSRLEDLDGLASPEAWHGLERYLGIAIRRQLREAIDRLQQQATALRAAFTAARTSERLESVRRQLVDFRRRYLRTETTLDFYADAINTRTNPEISALLRACDVLARQSMAAILTPLGKSTPHVLTYLDKGLGASILKAGLRLWDGGTLNPVAAIKIVRHNLYRPTSLIHEAGHQVAHMTGWTDELGVALQDGLSTAPNGLGAVWASWASEIAADGIAFVHTGYAAVASLHDVLSGDDVFVFRFAPGDPHPISYVRVLLGAEMCRQHYGSGPWDQLALAWRVRHPLANARPGVHALLRHSLPILPRVAEITLRQPARAFAGQALSSLVDPGRVRPEALCQLEQQAGAALYTSPHWVQKEALRLLALTGMRAATSPARATETLEQQKAWMLKLGASM